ncbi:hypothetical protein V1517DRAFT_318989 [Lipomyces orientalis]|uniref:Uncharacterized protein n=1 Tax=Lipomyces orientalis TaxID=1233043 RepID=A0ACC3TSM6_9ASCO
MTKICGSMEKELMLLYWYAFAKCHGLDILLVVDIGISQTGEQSGRQCQAPSTKLPKFVQQGYYGALKYRDHTWVGELNEAFIEVWRQNSHSRYVSSVIALILWRLICSHTICS